MIKPETIPYEKLGNLARSYGKAGSKIILQEVLTRESIIILTAAFFLGRASLAGGVMPFGLPVFAAAAGAKVNRILLTAVILLGMLTSGAREQIYVTFAAILLFNAFNLLFKNFIARINFRYAAISFVSILIPELVMVYVQGFLLYDLFKAVLNGFVAFAMVFIFTNAVSGVNKAAVKNAYTSEEIISTAITAALILSGLTDIGLFGFSLKNILCILLVVLFSYKYGPGVGAATGVTIGLIISMSSAATPLVIASYGFCGLLSGVLGSLGKMGVSLGFIMGNAILTLYMNGSTEVLIHLKEVIAAVVIFTLVPQKIADRITDVFGKGVDIYGENPGYSAKIKEIAVGKLNKFSRAFKELSKTFSEISETRVAPDKQDISVLFDRVAEKVCKDCSLCLFCWERNFYDTYQVMFKIVERLDSKGRIESKDIPDYFLERCARVNEFVEAVNNVYELFKIDMVWKSKIGESRGLVSQQLEGLSKVISNLAADIDLNLHFNSDMEGVLAAELGKAGIKVNEVIVYENKWGKYEIDIIHKGCGGKRSCVSSIEKLVSNLVGRKMVKENSDCHYSYPNGKCTLRLVEEERLRITTGVARKSKLEGSVSGDNYTFMNTGDGKYIIALSDGMGSGQKAAVQSRATVNLLEQFIESGFDRDTTIKLINSILVLKSNDDSFATMDISVIDLHDGDVEFIKVGASTTFVKREDRVEAIKLASLPAGILSDIETELIHKRVENGDFIIMTTDGINDAFKYNEEGEEGEEEEITLFDYIQDIRSMNPQEIANSIMGEASRRCGGKPMDDMLVIAAKVWKKAG